MRRRVVPSRAPALPRFIIPCPFCAGQMVVAEIEPSPLAAGVEDITHRCTACGCAVTQAIGPSGRELSRQAAV